MKKKLILFTAFVSLLFSCTRQEVLSKEEYMQWMENPENGMKKEKKIGDYSYRVFLKTPQYVACREMKNAKNEDNNQLESRIKQLGNYYYFNFDIVSSDGKESVLTYKSEGEQDRVSRINYFVSHAQQDFSLVQGNDTIPCVLYHFEQTYNLSALNTISLGFEKKVSLNGKNQDIQLIFNNRLFNTGDIIFSYSDNKLNALPVLKVQ